MAPQSTSLMAAFENDNDAFKALTRHFVQKQIDCDFYQLECKYNCLNFADNACLETNCEFY